MAGYGRFGGEVIEFVPGLQIIIGPNEKGKSTIRAFLADMAPEFTVVETGGAQIALSLHDLPSQPTIMVLEPAWLD